MGNAEYMGFTQNHGQRESQKKNNFLKKKLFNKPMEYNNIVYHEVPVEYEEQQTYECFVPRVQKGGSIGKRRPGKEPTLPDSALSREELDRRNNRRRRNREAAARVRDRRTGKMKHLENEVQQLKKEQKKFGAQKSNVARRVEKIKKCWKWFSRQKCGKTSSSVNPSNLKYRTTSRNANCTKIRKYE